MWRDRNWERETERERGREQFKEEREETSRQTEELAVKQFARVYSIFLEYIFVRILTKPIHTNRYSLSYKDTHTYILTQGTTTLEHTHTHKHTHTHMWTDFSTDWT